MLIFISDSVPAVGRRHSSLQYKWIKKILRKNRRLEEIYYPYLIYLYRIRRPRGLMDKASDFGSEDCEFESRRGRKEFFSKFFSILPITIQGIAHISVLTKKFHSFSLHFDNEVNFNRSSVLVVNLNSQAFFKNKY